MELKDEVEAIDEVPEAQRHLYIKDGETFKLEFSGVVPKARLDEFRTNKKKVDQELAEIKKRYEGIDPDEVAQFKKKYEGVDPDELQQLRDELAALKESGGKEKQQTKAELEAQIATLTKKHAKELGEIQKKNEADLAGLNGRIAQQNAELAREKIDGQIKSLAVENSVRPEAMTDVELRGSKVFTLVDGQVVAHKPDGTKWIDDATDKYITVQAWFKMLVKEAPHLFKESQGTGSSGSGSTKGSGEGAPKNGVNPWKPDTWNRTAQGAIVKEDIARARRLCREGTGREAKF